MGYLPRWRARLIVSRKRSMSASFMSHIGHAEQRGDGLFGRAGEVCAHHVREHVISRGLGILRGIVDVAWAVFLIADESLFTEDAQDGPDRGIRRRVGEFLHDFRDGRLGASVEDIHHLSFTAGERGRVGLVCHGW